MFKAGCLLHHLGKMACLLGLLSMPASCSLQITSVFAHQPDSLVG